MLTLKNLAKHKKSELLSKKRLKPTSVTEYSSDSEHDPEYVPNEKILGHQSDSSSSTNESSQRRTKKVEMKIENQKSRSSKK